MRDLFSPLVLLPGPVSVQRVFLTLSTQTQFAPNTDTKQLSFHARLPSDVPPRLAVPREVRREKDDTRRGEESAVAHVYFEANRPPISHPGGPGDPGVNQLRQKPVAKRRLIQSQVQDSQGSSD